MSVQGTCWTEKYVVMIINGLKASEPLVRKGVVARKALRKTQHPGSLRRRLYCRSFYSIVFMVTSSLRRRECGEFCTAPRLGWPHCEIEGQITMVEALENGLHRSGERERERSRGQWRAAEKTASLGALPFIFKGIAASAEDEQVIHMKLEPQEQNALRIALYTISCIPELPPFV